MVQCCQLNQQKTRQIFQSINIQSDPCRVLTYYVLVNKQKKLDKSKNLLFTNIFKTTTVKPKLTVTTKFFDHTI
jgi:hypothetical protein